MTIKDIKTYDLENLYKLYDEYIENTVDDENGNYFFEAIERCECCGEISFKEDMEERTFKTINTITCDCCKKCQEEIDDMLKSESEVDDGIDAIVDEMIINELVGENNE